MQATARHAKDDPAAWLAMDDIYGDVGRSPEFGKSFASALNALWASDTKTVLERYVG